MKFERERPTSLIDSRCWNQFGLRANPLPFVQLLSHIFITHFSSAPGARRRINDRCDNTGSCSYLLDEDLTMKIE
jgi:hypothetical protein